MDKQVTQKRRIREELLFRKNFEKYRYYTPIGKGEEFLKLLGSGKYLVGLISAANGVGKTRLGVCLIAELIWQSGNKWFNYPLFRNWKYQKKIRIVSDPSTIHDTIIPEMEEMFPKGRYKRNKKGKNYWYEWKTDNGWLINLMTYDQNVKEFESATLGLIWCDEPPPKNIYKANISRLRKGGVMFITATPLTGSAWMYDEILSNPNNESEYKFFVEAEVEDACKIHGVRGFLDHIDIVRMVKQYDDDDKQARVFGKFQHLVGLVYKMWNRQVHVVEPFDPDTKDYAVIELLDTHPRNPDAVMWVAIDRNNNYFVVDELYESDLKTEVLSQKIKDKAGSKRVEWRYIEPAAFIEDQHTGRSLYSDLYSNGLVYEQASKKRTEAIKLTKSALNYTAVGGKVIIPPKLFVCRNCVRTIWEIEHWQWKEHRGKSAENKSPSEKPVDKDDHMIENLGRALLSGNTFIEQIDYDTMIALTEGSLDDSTNLDPYTK